MVINTYNAILKIDPDNQRAGDELAGKFRTLGRWNDLIAVLTRKSEAPNVPDHERVKLLREVADLWSERFGNFANAIKPLERIAELDADRYRRDQPAQGDLHEAPPVAAADRSARQGSLDARARRAARRSRARWRGSRPSGSAIRGSRSRSTTGCSARPAAPMSARRSPRSPALYDREKRHLALRRDPASPGRARACRDGADQGRDRAAREARPDLHRAARGAAAGRRGVEGDPRARAEPREGAAHAARALRDGRRLRRARAAVRAARPGGRARRRAARDRGSHRRQGRSGCRSSSAPRSSRRSAPTSREGRSPRRRSRRRARCGSACSRSIRSTSRAATALAPIYEKQEKWTRLLVDARDRARRAHRAEGEAREDRADPRAVRAEARVEDARVHVGAARVRARAGEHEALRRRDAARERARPVARRGRRVRARDRGRHAARAAAAQARSASSRRSRTSGSAIPRWRAAITARCCSSRPRIAMPRRTSRISRRRSRTGASCSRRSGGARSARTRIRRARDAAARSRADPGAEARRSRRRRHRRITRRSRPRPATSRRCARSRRSRRRAATGNRSPTCSPQELAQTPEGSSARFDLLMRLGSLEEHSLERPAKALAYYREALACPAPGGGVRPQPVEAIARLVLVPETAAQARSEGSDRGGPPDPAAPRGGEAARRNKRRRSRCCARPTRRRSRSKTELDRAARAHLSHRPRRSGRGVDRRSARRSRPSRTMPRVRRALAALAGQLGRDGEWAQHLGRCARDAEAAGRCAERRPHRRDRARAARRRSPRRSRRPPRRRGWRCSRSRPTRTTRSTRLSADVSRAINAGSICARCSSAAPRSRSTSTSRLAALLQLAVLEEQMLGDPARAIAAYRRALELDPANVDAFTRARSAVQRGQAVARARGAARAPRRARSGAGRSQLAYRRAELFAHELGDPSRAVDLLEDVLGARARPRRRPRAARRAAERIRRRRRYACGSAACSSRSTKRDKLWKDLVRAAARAARPRRGHRSGRAARADRGRSKRPSSATRAKAFDAWLEVLKLEPTDERARDRAAAPRAVAAALARGDRRAREPRSTRRRRAISATRGALLGELATYYDTQLGDAPRAIAAYRRLLDADQSSPATQRRAGAALARLYEENGAWQELRDVNAQAGRVGRGRDRAPRVARAGRAARRGASSARRDAAIATWRDVLHDQPNDTGALHALERLYSAAERWRDLIEILRRMADQSPERRRSIAAVAGSPSSTSSA